MSDVLRVSALLAIAVDPLGSSVVFAAVVRAPDEPGRRRGLLAAAVGAAALLALAAVSSSALRDLLDVSPESLEIAAGLVILVPALRLLVRGSQLDVVDGRRAAGTSWRAALVPVAFPLAAGPGALLASAAYAAKEGTGTTLGAVAAVAVLLAVILHIQRSDGTTSRWPTLVGGRLMGAAMAVLAWDLITDGVLAV